ncbi:MAG: hypothetical protein JWP27_1680 [Flaviaesturariibacter sp.]|nr:hypothetical protein [Flaviaesturariibacter sp.]
MAKKIMLSVPEPCHEGWDQMSPTGKGRFCGSCQKEVIDFSTMSDAQLAAFFKKPAGSVCGRFLENQLNNPINVPRKHLPWLRYFFQVAVPAILFSQRGEAQGKVRGSTDTVVTKVPAHVVLGGLATSVITPGWAVGTILDNAGNPVPFASVQEKGATNGVAADAGGRFTLTLHSTHAILTVTAVGYEQREVAVRKDGDSLTVVLERVVSGMLGEVVVVRRVRKKPEPVMKKLADTLLSAFKVYPNPVQAGTSLNVEWKKPSKGSFDVTLVSLAGQVVLTTQVSPASKKELLRFDVPMIAPGIYILRFQNKETGRVYSQQVVVR